QGPQPRVAAPQAVPQAPPAPVTQVAQVAQVAQVSQVAPPQTPQAPAPAQLEVQFRPGSWELSAQARQEIERVVVPLLRERPGLYLRIEAPAPAAGDAPGAEGNLARERARALQSYVIKFGIPAERVLPVGTGPSCAECPDDRATLSVSAAPSGS
ncbi:MAG TPA: OmpA family protein, partial [Chloroflexota bacterium]|nr:OmpA family protein [Chloroflexota bacterium]